MAALGHTRPVEFGPLAHARYLLGVDVALGAAGGDQVADLGLQPGFLVTGGGPGVAEDRHGYSCQYVRMIRQA